jgi:hypothetical protein
MLQQRQLLRRIIDADNDPRRPVSRLHRSPAHAPAQRANNSINVLEAQREQLVEKGGAPI